MSTSSPLERSAPSLDRVILDTNIFVAAGFNPRSHAARVLNAVKSGELHMVWNEATRREIFHILRRIPPLRKFRIDDLFAVENQFTEPTHPEEFQIITDPDDRKFAALAHAANVVLVSRDDHLLEHRAQLGITVLTPQEYWSRYQKQKKQE